VLSAQQKTQKAARFPLEKPQLQRLMNPLDQFVERAARRRVLFRYEWGEMAK
jgi:hypothetical protein